VEFHGGWSVLFISGAIRRGRPARLSFSATLSASRSPWPGQFWENAIKLLLEDPKNARDLLARCGADILKRIHLRRVRLIQTTFVERDYRHVESDVVLPAPLRRERRERTAKHLVDLIEMGAILQESDRLNERRFDQTIDLPHCRGVTCARRSHRPTHFSQQM